MRKLTILVVVAVSWALRLEAQPIRGSVVALDEIRDHYIVAHLKFLASDLLEGRAPSTRGGSLAAEYIAAQFALLGLKPAGAGGTYYQDVPIVESRVDPSFTLTATASSGAPVSLKYGPDVIAFAGRQEERVAFQGELVFVGYGIIAPEYRWNDYEASDVRGKVVLVMVNDPPASPSEPELFGGTALTYYGRWTYKLEEAVRQGAAGAVLIHTRESATYPWQVVQSSWSGTQYALPVEAGESVLALKAWVTETAARQLVALARQDLDSLRASAGKRGFRAVPLGIGVEGEVRQTIDRKASPNVIGLVPGANSRQAVVYTAHYDHLGVRETKNGRDRIYNGARDNASGVAGILAVAQAFARTAAQPGRSVYFLATTAEESGLLGATYFAQHPPIPIDQLAANINVDELNVWGKTTDIVLLGSERSSLGPMAVELARARNRRLGPDPAPERGSFFRSDHFPLAKAGVPALSISDPVEYIGKDPGFAKKVGDEYNEKHYHQPSDEYDPGWDFAGAVEDLRFLAELGWRIGAAPAIPVYNEGDQFARPRQR